MREPPDWWKKWKPLRWLAGLGLLAAVAPHFVRFEIEAPPEVVADEYRYTDPAGAPLTLLDDFKSYDKLDEARAALEKAGYLIDTKRNRKPRSKKYPPRDLDSLIVKRYKHLGVEGRLELVFYNTFLYQAVFDAGDAAAYAPALAAAEPALVRDRLGTAEVKDGNRRVLTNVFFAAGPVGKAAGSQGWAMWQDLKLVKVVNEWEAQFGLIQP